MRAAVADGDFDAWAEHDVEFHRDIVKAAQNDVLLRAWDTLAVVSYTGCLIRTNVAS